MNTMLHKNPEDFLKRATEVASHYGFLPTNIAALEQIDIDKDEDENGKTISPKPKAYISKAKIPSNITDYIKKDLLSNEIASIMKSCMKNCTGPSFKPVFIQHINANNKSSLKYASAEKPVEKTTRFYLAVMGIKDSIAETILLKTTLAMLDEIGIKEKNTHINSIGDKDSIINFSNELGRFFRKNINSLPPQGRNLLLKREIFQTLEHINKKQHPLCKDVPKAIEFLSDKSRKHLMEVLEYLEAGDIAYEMDDRIVNHGDFYSDTLFEIRGANNSARDSVDQNNELTVFARGGRCNDVSRKLFKLDIPFAFVVLEYAHNKITKLPAIKKNKSPKIYFVQFGYEARLRSLSLIEILRKANIQLYHCLGKSKLSEQMIEVEKAQAPYVIIMGQKEALEGTVIVRDMATRAQNIIQINILPSYLKGLKI